ncbi:phage tail protein [Sphingomonas sp. C3-2]|uniref:phage tail protein n=1 Tax=Sphingomonas sp. C3-2 TaxID=3062169 RepID=UPI00294AC076|nr:phage tail protein [Sphingomonas sp. C3-2]WOK36313.1 phage tail protein [Sphingomonas sp. C3-2]
MATLVLTVAGAVVGGQIGAAVGAIIGQQIDQRLLFAPKGRQGPRLGDLAVQTSTYGTPIPRLFGTMRVAGTVIWATDLVERRETSGGGKGRPRTTSYSYSTSFAVALSARRVRRIRRIWADGKLLRGAGGDFKTETGFRFHDGDEDQAPDPLIAAIEGVGRTPAYRGIAYAVFEHFQLGDYGNRIPMLTFEVEADEGAVGIGTIADVLSDGDVTGASGRLLGGYAASGDSVRGAVEILARAAPLALGDDGERLVLAGSDAEPVTVRGAELGATRWASRDAVRDMRLAAAMAAPVEIALSYYEPARDYQAGLHSARRPGAGRLVERIELPAALSAGEAKAIAEDNLSRAWSARGRRTLFLPWRHIGIGPAALVRIDGELGLWRVEEVLLEQMVLRVSLSRVRAEAQVALPAEPGRAVGEVDRVHGPTVIHAFELPGLGDEPLRTPQLCVAAAGALPGWRRAALSLSLDAGMSWNEPGMTTAPATMGETVTPLAIGTPFLFDDRNSADVALLHEEMALFDADDGQLAAGANLALIGDELIQFGRAEALGNGRYRLSHLLRGRRGSECAVADHGAGERFVRIEAETIRAIDVPVSALGTSARVLASGVGDHVAATAEALVTGQSVAPPMPVAITGERLANDDIALRWTRRSRMGWRWADGIEVPLGEERELYRIVVRRDGAVVRSAETATPQWTYPRALELQDRDDESELIVEVMQLGTLAASLSAIFPIPAI